MRTKVKSFILTALLFISVSAIIAQAQSSVDSAVKKAQHDKKLQEKWSLSALEGKWYLQSDPGDETISGRIPEIQFDTRQGRLSGTTGCNQMSGSFTATDSSLHIHDKMITTRMFCPGYNETDFLQNLLKADGYHFHREWLILTSKGVVVSRWSRKIPKPDKTGKTQVF